MRNSNCLKDIACPECKQSVSFDIESIVVVRVSDDGVDEQVSDHYWDDASHCVCNECEHQGPFSTFRVPHTEKGGAK